MALVIFTGTTISFAEQVEEVEMSVVVFKVPPDGSLPRTGQTVSYYPYDDGYYQFGNPVQPRFEDTGLTIIDYATGLEWEQKTTGPNSINSCNNKYSWFQAFDVHLNNPAGATNGLPEGLNIMNSLQGFANHNDWRVPNINEFRYLINYGKDRPVLHPVFKNVNYYMGGIGGSWSYPFCTSTTDAIDASKARSLELWSGSSQTNTSVNKDWVPGYLDCYPVHAVRKGNGGLH